MMTTAVRDAAERQLVQALKYAPIEDQIQLGLEVIGMPCIDSPDDTQALLEDANEVQQNLQAKIASLQAENAKLKKKSASGK